VRQSRWQSPPIHLPVFHSWHPARVELTDEQTTTRRHAIKNARVRGGEKRGEKRERERERERVRKRGRRGICAFIRADTLGGQWKCAGHTQKRPPPGRRGAAHDDCSVTRSRWSRPSENRELRTHLGVSRGVDQGGLRALCVCGEAAALATLSHHTPHSRPCSRLSSPGRSSGSDRDTLADAFISGCVTRHNSNRHGRYSAAGVSIGTEQASITTTTNAATDRPSWASLRDACPPEQTMRNCCNFTNTLDWRRPAIIYVRYLLINTNLLIVEISVIQDSQLKNAAIEMDTPY